MDTIAKQYIINEKNKKVAVQLSIETFEQIEEILENYALYHLMNEDDDKETLNTNEAKEYYKKLKKHNESRIS
ncbi:MAG: hypothetical protein A2275_19035 [Bacteroidetes bacterium RIFOXYA12_FULL_35_11]|nr:MAG: hypothetical protein A2275_19035 [Bacteroidetes bacterium RIFOXYA12_FULL_35_11]OFY99177.1 MAG: hypothetical protein A2491_11540 [Bacteroidetes bacterium RIFOXYC12_FULL_35_7]